MSFETIEGLDAIDKEILRLKYMNRKLSYREIGQLLPEPITLQAVHSRFKKAKMQKQWMMLEKDVIIQLKDLQFKAIEIVRETLEGDDKKQAFQAAKMVLEPIIQNAPSYLPKELVQSDLEFELSDAPIVQAEA